MYRPHSQQHVHVIDSGPRHEELILLGPTYFQNFSFDDWGQLLPENVPCGIWLPRQDGHRADSLLKHVELCGEAPSYDTIEMKLRPLTRSVSGD